MSNNQHKVKFQPQGRSVSVLDGTTVLEAAGNAGLVLDTPCGGAGTCGKCRVRITAGADQPTEADRNIFSQDELNNGWRLACQNIVRRDLTVEVPSASLFAEDHQILLESTVGDLGETQPAIRKVYVQLTPPTLEDNRPDLLRLEDGTGPLKIDISTLRHVPPRMREQGYEGTAVLSDHRLIDFEEGDTSGSCYAIAFDIGTTTMVGSLIDLCTGRELGVTSRMNPQVSFGDDVLSRIKHATSCPHCLDELSQAVIEEVSNMVEALRREAKASSQHIYEAAFAGNTTMQHLICGADPSPMGQVPFAPAYGRGVLLSARDMEVPINPHGMAYIFPVIGGFVGGDTVAGMLATRIDEIEGPVLMVDIGTNGEIVLAHDGKLTAASTAAGPAFEGARISCGMRATRGAVEKVVIDDDVNLGVIGDVSPIGICGSGLIDLVAELLNAGIISSQGHIKPTGDLPPDLPESIAGRIHTDDNDGATFVLSESGDGRIQNPVTLTQRDIRELQLGCGAIRAGVSILLDQSGLIASDLKTVLIAGGFGSFIRPQQAQRLGLIPTEVDLRRVHYVGNASLAGVRWALSSVRARKKAEKLARQTNHVELSTSTDFQAVFAESMIFPDK